MGPKKRTSISGWVLLVALAVIEVVLFFLWSSYPVDDDAQLLLNIVVWAVGIVTIVLLLILFESGREPHKKG